MMEILVGISACCACWVDSTAEPLRSSGATEEMLVKVKIMDKVFNAFHRAGANEKMKDPISITVKIRRSRIFVLMSTSVSLISSQK